MKKQFKDSEDFLFYLGDVLTEFLEDITSYPQYTYPATGERPLVEYEENITFYYTQKGMNLIDRWMKRMEKLFNKNFPYDTFEKPQSTYYKEF